MLGDKHVFKESDPKVKQNQWTYSPQKTQHKVYAGFKHWVAEKATVSASKHRWMFQTQESTGDTRPRVDHRTREKSFR